MTAAKSPGARLDSVGRSRARGGRRGRRLAATQLCSEEGRYPFDVLRRIERVAAVRGAMHDDEVDLKPLLLVRALELVRLVDRHLRVLVPVQQHQRRIRAVDLEHRARELRERLGFFRRRAE